MAAPADNKLYNVETVGEDILVNLELAMPVTANANTAYQNFQGDGSSYGNSVQIPTPFYPIVNDGLDLVGGNFDTVEFNFETLTVGGDDQHKAQSNYIVSDVQRLFEKVGTGAKWTPKIASAYALGIATKIEASVSREFLNTYRSFGTWNGTTGVIDSNNTYSTLAKMIVQHRNFGAPESMLKCWLPDTIPSEVIDNGFAQFVMNRNDQKFTSWKLGSFYTTDFYPTALLPTHISGTMAASSAGPEEDLTFTSIDPTGTQLTFATAGAAKTILENDIIVFNAGGAISASGPLRYLQPTSKLSAVELVSCRVIADAVEGAGAIVVQIDPRKPLLTVLSDPHSGSINRPLEVTDIAHVVPSRKVGMISSDDAFFVSVPALPDTGPYNSSHTASSEYTNISIRARFGHLFNKPQQGFIFDALWGARAIGDFNTQVFFPIDS